MTSYRLRIAVEEINEECVEALYKSEFTINPEQFEGGFDDSNALELFHGVTGYIQSVFNCEDN